MIEAKESIWKKLPYRIERGTSMLRILICDDDEAFLNELRAKVEELLSEIGVRAKVHTYSQSREISENILSSCDIAFLDIDLAEKDATGIDVAKKLRRLRKDTIIVFITNYIEFAPEGYEVNAFRYLLKNEIDRKLQNYIQLAITQLKAVREIIKISINGELIDICINDILFFESQQHAVIVNVRKDINGKQIKQYRFYSSLTELEKNVESQGFLRVHKSYLVNMAHIQRYQCHEVVLTNGVILKVSEKNYAQQKKKYLLWKGR